MPLRLHHCKINAKTGICLCAGHPRWQLSHFDVTFCPAATCMQLMWHSYQVKQLVIYIFLLIRLEGEIPFRIRCAGQQEAFLYHKVFQEGVGVLVYLTDVTTC